MLDLAAKPGLAHDSKTEIKSVEGPRLKFSQIAAGIFLVAIAGFTLGVYFANKSAAQTLTRLDNDYGQLSSEIQSGDLAVTAAKAEAVTNLADIYTSFSKNRILGSLLLKEFQITTSSNVIFKNLSVGESNVVKVEAQTQTYDQVAGYLATLRASSFITRVELLSTSFSASEDGDRVSFSASLTLNEAKIKEAGGK